MMTSFHVSTMLKPPPLPLLDTCESIVGRQKSTICASAEICGNGNQCSSTSRHNGFAYVAPLPAITNPTSVRNKLVQLHLKDAPWRPSTRTPAVTRGRRQYSEIATGSCESQETKSTNRTDSTDSMEFGESSGRCFAHAGGSVHGRRETVSALVAAAGGFRVLEEIGGGLAWAMDPPGR